MKTILRLFFFLLSAHALAQNGLPPNAGARGAALGNTSVAFQGIQSAFTNAAGLATLPSWGFIGMGEQRFLLPEIRSVAAAAAVAGRAGTFGLQLHYFGFESYNEQRLGLLYARKIFEDIYIGAGMDLLNTRVPDFGNQLNATGSLGIQANFAEPLWLGFHLFNPFRIERQNGDYYPTLMKVGFSYQFSKKLLLAGEAEKDIDFPLRWKGGLEYQYLDMLAFRTGFSTQPIQATLGAGLSWNNGLRFDFAFQWHQTLGWTPAFSAIFQPPAR